MKIISPFHCSHCGAFLTNQSKKMNVQYVCQSCEGKLEAVEEANEFNGLFGGSNWWLKKNRY